ncbi:MAG: hypothetical protein ACTSRZ_14580 [Promethearchaeota archaeon]
MMKELALFKKGKELFLSMNLWKIFSFLLIGFIFVEWLPSFIEIVANFMIVDFRNISTDQLFSLVSFVLTPIISFILLIPSYRFPEKMLKISKIILVFSLIFAGVLSWYSYQLYYQLMFGLNQKIPGLESFAEILGLSSDYTYLLQQLLVYTNIILFIIIIPFLFLIVSDGNGFIKFDRDLDLALIAFGLYLALRFGSNEGILLRFPIILSVFSLIGSIKLYILLKKNKGNLIGNNGNNIIENNINRNNKLKTEKSNSNDEKPSDEIKKNQIINTNNFEMNQIPTFASIGIMLVFGTVFSAIGLFNMGFLYQSWPALFLPIGVILRTIIENQLKNIVAIKYEQIDNPPQDINNEQSFRSKSFKVSAFNMLANWRLKIISDIIIFVTFIVFAVSLMYAHVDPILIKYEPYLLAFIYFLTGFNIPKNSFIFASKSRTCNHKSPKRSFFFQLFGFLGITLPFISGLFDPLLEEVSAILICISSFISLAILFALNLKKLRR